MNHVWDYIEKATCIIDIGVCAGPEVGAFLNKFPEANIYLFEPNPKLYGWLLNRHKDNERCHIYDVAISNTVGDQEFYLSGHNGDSSSLKKPTDIMRKVRDFEHVLPVKVSTLDLWAKLNNIRHVDLIWADVQGNEREMILGAKETLKITQYFYTEYNQAEYYEGVTYLDEILDLVSGNFDIVKIFTNKNHGGDILFKNRKELPC